MKLPLSLLAVTALCLTPGMGAMLVLNPANDTYVRGGTNNPGSQNTNFGGSVELLLGSIGVGDAARPLLTFDLSAPELVGATINSVSLTFVTSRNDTGSTTSSVSYSLYQLTETFVPTQATWAVRQTSTNWSTYTGMPLYQGGGGVFNPTALSSISVTPNGIGSGTTVTFGNTAGFASLVGSSLGGSLQLLLKQNTESSTRNLLGFNSVDATNAALRPELTIDFTPIPEPSTYAMLFGGLALVVCYHVRKRGRRA